VLLALALLAGSCGQRQPPGIQRLAILRFENMTPALADDWIGRGLAEVVTAALAGSGSIYAIPASRLHTLNAAMGARPIAAPGISAEAPLAHALGANRIGYGEYAISGGRLRVRLTIEDPHTRGIALGPLEAEVDERDPAAAAVALARQISKDAQPYGTANGAALEAYIRGLEASDTTAIRRHAEQAVAADPKFGPAYVLLVESAIKQQDRTGATAALQAAAARGSAFSKTVRLRLEILSATLRGDSAAVASGLTALTQTTPVDPAAWRALAESAAGRRDYQQALAAHTRALSIEPEEASGWNQLGYVSAYAGNVDAALTALRRYQSLRPADPNPLDSMGDVNLMFGRLKEAEGLYLEAHKKDPAFLNGGGVFKAAMARLMTGDVAGAGSIIGDKAGTAEWKWLTGRRQEAYDQLSADAVKLTQPEAQARAWSQLAVWAALLDDRTSAARAASRITAATPATALAVALARFIALPPAPASEWTIRAERLFPNPAVAAVKEVALSYALLLDRHFADAIPLLRNMDARAGSGGDRSAAIKLAWALIETGKVAEAAPLLRMNPVPGADPSALFIGLYFPRLFQLRAIVADREGKADEARENRRVYTALGGR
jgi:Flp pilus assembly protein TadD